jgi:hypothetical protein
MHLDAVVLDNVAVLVERTISITKKFEVNAITFVACSTAVASVVSAELKTCQEVQQWYTRTSRCFCIKTHLRNPTSHGPPFLKNVMAMKCSALSKAALKRSQTLMQK